MRIFFVSEPDANETAVVDHNGDDGTPWFVQSSNTFGVAAAVSPTQIRAPSSEIAPNL